MLLHRHRYHQRPVVRAAELRAQINPQLERAARKRSKCDAVVDGVVDADVRRSRPLRFHGISGAL